MKFHIITLGCKVNTYESNYLSESLVSNGFLFCDDVKDADIVIINTCTVTDTSDKKSLKMVRRVKRECPDALLVVCGCSVQYNPHLYENQDINILIGTKGKKDLPHLIEEYFINHENYYKVDPKRSFAFEDMEIKHFNQVRAYIKIQDGCDNFCSYCIIPFVRGSVRSKNYNTVLKEAKDLVNNGFKEIVLTGIHTGSYNDNGKDLYDLIDDLSKIEGLKRIRLSSIEITELNDKFMELLKNNHVLCDHLHIPLQAGCDEILKIMNRKYDTKYYEEKIAKIRSIRPNISITTDVIVGHNFETEELFQKTYDFCEKIGFAKIHVFPYSKREGTATSKMDCPVDEKDKKDRSKRLINLSEKLEKAYFDKFKGQKLDVLVETVKDDASYGHTSNFLYVKVNEKLKVGEIYQKEI